MSRVIYADNNATTCVAPEVVEAMLPFVKDYYGNPSSMHSFGGNVEREVVKARESVASVLGAEPSEIIFTSGGTEGDNAAIRGILESVPDKKHIITSRVEHPAVLNLCRYLAQQGYSLTEIGVDSDGMINPDDIANAIRNDTAIVSIMWANNETGIIFPIEEIASIVKERGVIFHCDAVQAVGKIPIDVRKTPIDLLTLSGHKLHAPKGIGSLYVRKGTRFKPFVIGGHQERGRRGGTENVPGIVALGKACELIPRNFDEETSRIMAMRDKLEKSLLDKISNSRRNGHKDRRLPNTSSVSFEFVEGEGILLLLNEFGICASSGSACTSGSLEPSHVLRAMGVPFTFAHGSVRFSLSRYNEPEEVDIIVEKLPDVITRLRSMSPYWKGE
jgi:cysteine desulfurase